MVALSGPYLPLKVSIAFSRSFACAGLECLLVAPVAHHPEFDVQDGVLRRLVADVT